MQKRGCKQTISGDTGRPYTGRVGFSLPYLLVLLAAVALAGCQGGGSPGAISFSPDGSTIAYTYVERLDLPLPPEMPTIHSTVYLRWCRADHLQECSTLEIDSYGKSYGSFVQGRFALLFSPDSKRLAVRSPRYLEVVDLVSGKRQRLTGPEEPVERMGWLGNSEMVYAVDTESPSAAGSHGMAHRIFRHPITAQAGKRTLLYEKHDAAGQYHDAISPTGEHVVFWSGGTAKGQLFLLHTRSGKVIPLTEEGGRYQGVSWKPDGSCVFCLTSREALLWYPKEGRKKDLGAAYDNSLRHVLQGAPELDERWTPDGAYIAINAPETGGCLVRPDPWHVVPVGKQLVHYVEETKKLRVSRSSPESYPYLFVQPYPGWVRIWVQIVPEKTSPKPGWPGLLETRSYLVDYEAGRFLPMPSSDTPGGGWSLRPDGRKIVFFNHSLFLNEKAVDLPPATKQELHWR